MQRHVFDGVVRRVAYRARVAALRHVWPTFVSAATVCRGRAGVWAPLVAVVIAIVTIPVTIPMMIVLAATAIAFPIAFVEALAIMTGHHPHSTRIGRARPVSVMPPVMVAYRIPVAVHPNEPRSRSHRPDPYDSTRRWWADGDTNRYLSEEGSSHEEQKREQLLCHRGSSCSAALMSASGRVAEARDDGRRPTSLSD